jgi:hypothetical protein
MDNDTNGIACLVTGIFSIIANSGATEYNFSDFGNIQTKRCSCLSVDKTHKINMVQMDIWRCHAALGVLKLAENKSWATTMNQRAQPKIRPPTMKMKTLVVLPQLKPMLFSIKLNYDGEGN